MNLTREEARDRAAHLVVDSYEVLLDLTGDETFPSTTRVRFASSRPGSTTFIDLIAPAVRRVVLNGSELDPADVADGARIRLPGLREQNELLVEADCAFMRTGEGLHRFVDPVDGDVYLHTHFEPADARRVFAVFDQPDLKASFAFTVVAPASWLVVSNSPAPTPVGGGTAAAERSTATAATDGPTATEGSASMAEGAQPTTGTATWRFAPTQRISSYITAIVAGPYEVVQSEVASRDGRTIPLGLYCRRSLARYLDADEIFDITRRGFAYFESSFGVAYPFEKYDQLFVPEFNAGGMENAAAVTLAESFLFRSRVPEETIEVRAEVILHELAHMWFGDLVTMRWWDDLWLNESFASYEAAISQAEATRWTSAWTTFAQGDKAWAYRQDQLPSTHPVVADIVDIDAAQVGFDGITYAKGASVIRQLVAWVGRGAFEEALRRYFVRHAWGNTELSDLLAELEATSGRDLQTWSRLWLESAGVATLRPELQVNAEDVITSLAVRQEAPADHPTLRPHRLAIGSYDLVDGILTRTNRVELDVEGPSTPVPELVGRRRPDLLLLNDDDLAYARIRLDERSLATAKRHLGTFADGLPRALVWSAAWDMTRDAELPARDFVELALANLMAETDSSVVRGLLAELESALSLYVAPEHRDEASAAAAGRLLEQMRAAAAGSDTQLQLVKSVAALAVTDDQLDAIAGLLDGRLSLEGLEIDTDLRWDLLIALVAGGRAGDDAIDAELARDDTATGEREAATARAARPSPEAKLAAWASVVESASLSNAVQGSVIAGFNRVHDRSLLEPFVDPYFSSVLRVWETRTNHIAQQILLGLYPTLLASDRIVELTDRLMARVSADHGALRRLLLEKRDGVARVLRAQERDHRR